MKKSGVVLWLVIVVICEVSIVFSGQAGKRSFSAIQSLAGQLGSFPYTGVGCFRDAVAKPRPFPEMIGNLRNEIDLTNPNSTVAKCAAKAYMAGFQFFAIEYMGECWSGAGANLTYNKFGPSSQCLNGLGGEESLFVYKFNSPPKPLSSVSGLKCFPARTTVELKNGRQTTMAELQLGQEVKTLGPDGGTKYSEVIAFLHKVPTGSNTFLRFSTEGGTEITLTPEHLIYVVSPNGLGRQVLFAKDVKIGDKLMTSGDVTKSVSSITIVNDEGLYAPLTIDGTLFADGVLVSCYAHVRSHELGHLMMAPVRALRLLSGIFQEFVVHSTDNLPSSDAWNTAVNFYSNTLLAFTNYLPFKDTILSISPCVKKLHV